MFALYFPVLFDKLSGGLSTGSNRGLGFLVPLLQFACLFTFHSMTTHTFTGTQNLFLHLLPFFRIHSSVDPKATMSGLNMPLRNPGTIDEPLGRLMSLNVALFANVLLASRLSTSTEVFAFLFFGIE